MTENSGFRWKNTRMILMRHGGETVKLWVNPEEIRLERSMLHRVTETAAGEVLQMGGPGLARVTLETMLPAEGSAWREEGTSPAEELRLLHKWCGEECRVAVHLDGMPAEEYCILSLAEILREGDRDVGVVIELTQARTEEDIRTLLPQPEGGPDAPEPEPEEAEDIPAVYTVVRGDNLSRIARRLYGDSGRWRDIYNANRDQIDDPNLIYPGQRLVIP